MLGQPNPRPNARGTQASLDSSPLRRKSNDDDMVDRYWRKVKAKFGQLASQQARDNQSRQSRDSFRSLSRHRSMSPYDPEGNLTRSRKEMSPTANGSYVASNYLPNSNQRSLNNGTPLSPQTDVRGSNKGSALGTFKDQEASNKGSVKHLQYQYPINEN